MHMRCHNCFSVLNLSKRKLLQWSLDWDPNSSTRKENIKIKIASVAQQYWRYIVARCLGDCCTVEQGRDSLYTTANLG